MTTLDMRVPVRLSDTDHVPAADAALIEGRHFAAGQNQAAGQDHAAGCACCTARNLAGRALASLLQDRARGKVAFFRGVTVVTRTAAGREMVLEALRTDPVASACFQLEG